MIREVIETIRPDQPFDAMRSVRVIVSPDLMDSENINVQDKNITIEENGLTVVTPDTGYQGLGEVQITTNVPGKKLELKSANITTNGLKTIEPDEGFDGLSLVHLNVNVPSSVNNQNKTVVVESNGFQQIVPDQGYSGIGELNLNVDVPQPVIQDNDIRYINPSNESRQVIVEPGQGFDALKKVTINVASAALVIDQNILSLTSNGTFSLPSLLNSQALGFADSCTVNVNVPSGINIRYISLSSAATAVGKVDLSNVTFSGPGLTTYEIPVGRTLLLITEDNGNIVGFRAIGNRTGAPDVLTTNFTSNVLVTEINYDIGDRVYLKDENEKVIMSVGVYQAGDYNYRTTYYSFNPDIIKFMYNSQI